MCSLLAPAQQYTVSRLTLPDARPPDLSVICACLLTAQDAVDASRLLENFLLHPSYNQEDTGRVAHTHIEGQRSVPDWC